MADPECVMVIPEGCEAGRSVYGPWGKKIKNFMASSFFQAFKT